MKKTFYVFLVFMMLSPVVFAESSKITKLDLDVKTTHIVKADIGRDDLYYYMDVTACICWVSQSMGSSFSVSTFDCSKLALHPKFAKFASECGMVKQEESKKEVVKEEPVATKVEEVKTDEPKKEEVKATEDTKQPEVKEPEKKEEKKTKK